MGVCHTLSSAYFPQSNGRTEVAVRITKRLLEDNVGPDGSIDNDKMVRALLQLQNTPDRDCNLSPAEVLFGHRLKEAMPQLDKSVSVFESSQVHPNWRESWSAKEKAIRSRFAKTCKKLEQNSKELPPLREGDTVFIQNQSKAFGKPNKWDREGTIIQTGVNDQYLVRVHGTGRITLRSRKFLRKFALRSPKVATEPSFHAAPQISMDRPRNTAEAGTRINQDTTPTSARAADRAYSSEPARSINLPDLDVHSEQPDMSHAPAVDLPAEPATSTTTTSASPQQVVAEEPKRPLRKSQCSYSERLKSSRAPSARHVYDTSTGKYVVQNKWLRPK